MRTKLIQLLILPALILAGCQAQNSARLSQIDTAARMIPAQSASLAISPADVQGSWLMREYRTSAGTSTRDALLEFNADGTYVVLSAADRVRLGGGEFRLDSGNLVLESDGCFWPPHNKLQHCTGVYVVRAVHQGDTHTVLTFELVMDKDDPQRATNLHSASLMRIFR